MERYRVGLIAGVVLLGLTLCPAASASAQGDGAALHLRVAMKAVDEGEFEIALDEVREAAKIAPTDPVIQFAMATILDKREKVDEALAALDKAQALGLPEAYREKADDLRVTLLYKQKKNLRAASAPPPPAPPGFGGFPGPAGRGFPPAPPLAGAAGRGGAGRGVMPANFERFSGGDGAAPPTTPAPLPVPGRIVATTITKEDGKYSVNLPDGTCVVEFQLAGFKVYRYEVLGSQGATIDARMSVGGTDRLVTADRPPRGPANTARGKITDTSGFVLPGVTVTVYKP